jgi:hypothetical protein
MKKSLITFLFGESQVDEELAALVEDIADMDTEGASTITVEKAPLSKIIDDLGIEGGSLEADPRGLSLVFDDNDLFRAAHALLNQPDSLYKLASAGWVYSVQGDVAQAYEPAQFRIRFLEIDEIKPDNMKGDADAGVDARNKKVAEIVKKGREFATEKPEHDDDTNPVEYDDKTSKDRHKGMGKEKDGAQPEGKPKGSTKESKEKKYRRVKCDSCEALVINGVAAHEHGCPNSRKPWVVSDDDEHLVPGERSSDDVDEAQELPPQEELEKASQRLYRKSHRWLRGPERDKVKAHVARKGKGFHDAAESLIGEGGHKAGCQCGFCKNKGSFGKKPKSDGGEVDGGESTTDSTDMKEESLKAEEIVNTMLEWNPKNPGTQPGILGTHSFSTMKVPKGSKDRKFSPAPGMVQPDSEIVNKQAKRKVNGGK